MMNYSTVCNNLEDFKKYILEKYHAPWYYEEIEDGWKVMSSNHRLVCTTKHEHGAWRIVALGHLITGISDMPKKKKNM